MMRGQRNIKLFFLNICREAREQTLCNWMYRTAVSYQSATDRQTDSRKARQSEGRRWIHNNFLVSSSKKLTEQKW